MKYFKNYNDLIFKKLNSVDGNEFLRISRIFLKVKKTNNKLIFVGNGGSAAISSHVSVDFTKVCKILLHILNFNLSREFLYFIVISLSMATLI